MGMTVDEFGAQIEAPKYSVKISRQSMEGELCLESVPPGRILC